MENLFGQLLKNLRMGTKVTQQAVADFCNITKQYMSDIEKGRNDPPQGELLKKMAEFFNLSGDSKKDFFDTAARVRGDVAVDIKDILINNPDEIVRLRKQYGKK